MVAAVLCLVLACGAFADNEYVIKNSVMTRTMSVMGGPLRTTKLEAGGAQFLSQATVEFMIDIDNKGKGVYLAPSDFDIGGVETDRFDTEVRTTFKLQSRAEGVPLTIYLRYHRTQDSPFLQKSIEVTPCKEMAGAILRRVMLEDVQLKPEFVSVSPVDRFGGASGEADKPDLTDAKTRFVFGGVSSYAAIDRKSNRGLLFYMDSLYGREAYMPGVGISLYEDLCVPLEKGHQTGRATLATVSGPPEVLFKRFRDLRWDNWCVLRPKLGNDAAASVTLTNDPPSFLQKSGVTEPKAALFGALTGLKMACDELRAGKKDMIVDLAGASIGSSLALHLLGAADRFALPSASALRLRQLRYANGFVLPGPAIGAPAPSGLASMPLDQAKPALIGMLSSSPMPTLVDAPAESKAYCARLSAFQKRFAAYMRRYQQVLDFPDGNTIDGEAHVVSNKGFIILYNPTAQVAKIAIPLAEPGLELRGEVKLTDWSDLDQGSDLGSARVGTPREIELAPGSARIIGINIQP